jgi:transposase
MMMIAQVMAVPEEVRFVGIDVGKFTAVVGVHGQSGVRTFEMDAEGQTRLLGHLSDLPGVVQVGLEASGGYEAALWERLEAAGVHVRQLAPAMVHAYARSVGRRAKTDACDAATIAAYMAANPLAGRRIPEANVRQIKALAAKRRQLIEMRKALACQMKQARPDLVAGLDDTMMALIEAQITTLEKTIDGVIGADEGLAAKRRLLRSIPGIGEVSAFTLIGDMPELGTLTAAAAASLAGLAPFARDSGTLTGPRFIQAGRNTVRDVLYMAAVSASCHAPSLKPFADRLKERHKPGKQVIIAVARKLVELANTVIARQSQWLPR